MKIVFVCGILCAGTILCPSFLGAPSGRNEFAEAVVREMNFARTSPKAYVKTLTAYRRLYKGKLIYRPGKVPLRSQEGVSAVDEAIRYCLRVNPVGKLVLSPGMSRAAADHIKDTGPRGSTGHYGSDGSTPFARMNRYGRWRHRAGENIAYGQHSARAVVRGLIIDDGVPGRGHRRNIFNGAFRVCGVARGSHRRYRTMCVITYAGGYREAAAPR